MKLLAALSVVVAVVVPGILANCGGTDGWRVRSEVVGLNWSDAQSAFQQLYGITSSSDFALRHNKNLVTFTLNGDQSMDITEQSQESPAGNWKMHVDPMHLQSNQCLPGTRTVEAKPSGSTSTYNVAVSGETYIKELSSGKVYLYYRITSCAAASGSIADSILNEMCNTNIATHALTNVIRGSCAMAAKMGVGTKTVAQCYAINIDGSI